MLYTVHHWIDGKRHEHKGRELAIFQPDIATQIGVLSVADKNVVEQAVASSQKAYLNWSKTTPVERAQILFKFKSLLDQNTRALAETVTREHGKTLEEAIGSVKRGIEVLDFACGIPYLLQGKHAANVANNIDSYVLQQPLGVCVGITPFNFPAMIPLWMFTMAIACGNTFVLKPSEKDPSVALQLAEFFETAGLPLGVLNIVQGDSETVDHLINHQEVKAVSFVGSSAIAENISHKATAQNKRVQAFGGAKNHCVVMPDADIEKAAENIIAAAFGSAGERCMAISAVVAVTDETAEKLLLAMKKHINHIKVGSGWDSATTMGPVVTAAHFERVQSYIELGKKEGAALVVDGSQCKMPAEKGYYIAPYLFDHVKQSMRIYRDEIFGPVLVMLRVENLEAAIKLINEHDYANGGAIFTSSGVSAHQFSRSIDVGMIGINLAVPIPAAYVGFGGWKQSCFADLGMYGEDAIRFYTQRKKIIERWLSREKI